MNFFDAQDRARRATRWLVLAYLLATVVIVAAVTGVVYAALYMSGQPGPPDASLLVGTAVLAALLIVGSTVYKTAALSAGGGKVATDMGGTPVPPDVTDPLRRRLRNVVEEMSIASGVPVPEIYVLEQEQGINAFAAGYTPGDAAIAVTRGALETLDRDELQGVIAHEFSHILNGDMRLSIRMMGVLFGIMVLGLIGRVVLRGSFHRHAFSSRRNRSQQAPAALAIGLGLVILGWIGVLIARLIKAAISRKRESLADAAAVQFTRQTEGLAGALKKIGGYEAKSYIRAKDPEQVSHMLFSFGSPRLTSLFATHPPLTERIRALDPTFREEDYAKVQFVPQDDAAEAASAFGAAHAFAGAAPSAAAIADSMGRPDPRQIGLARELRASLPPILYEAAHSPVEAALLVFALALDRSGRHLERQLAVLEQQLGPERRVRVEQYHAALRELGPRHHLPLLEVAFPALKQRPPEQLEYLLDLSRRLVETDGELELHEYCLWRVLAGNLRQAADPASSGNRVARSKARRAAVELVGIVAQHGNREPAAQRAAFDAGVAVFGPWARETSNVPERPASIADLDRCLDILQGLNGAGRRTLVEAVAATILHDRTLELAESELLRAICAALDCPLPPIVAS